MKMNGEKNHKYDAVVIGTGVAGLYQLHLLRNLDFQSEPSRKELTLVALGIGTGILAVDSTQKAIPINIPFLMSY